MNTLLDELRPLAHECYEGVNLNLLTIYAVGDLENRNIDLSFENIVVAAFRLFPMKFSLLGYPSHPDAKRVHDALWRCAYKDRQWLRGKTSQGFMFTERGLRALDEAKRAVGAPTEQRKKVYSRTRRWEKIFDELTCSPGYRKYAQGKRDVVTEAECCDALQGTLDSDRQVLMENLNKLKEIADDLQQSNVASFLNWLEQRFAGFLGKESDCEKIRDRG